MGLALAGLSPVDQEELAHPAAYCNTHKASHSGLLTVWEINRIYICNRVQDTKCE